MPRVEHVTTQEPPQLVIGDVRPEREVGNVVSELLDCAIALTAAIDRA